MNKQSQNDRLAAKEKISIFILDDHPVIIEGLSMIISAEADMYVCGQATCVSDAVTKIAKLKPKLCIIDISLPDGNGIELTKDLCHRYTEMTMLIMSAHDEHIYAERAIRAGAMGYINKTEAAKNIVGAIRDAVTGKISLSQVATSRILNRLSSSKSSGWTNFVELLSDRELEILKLLGKGLTNGQVAEKCFISTKTVESYIERMKTKLNFKNSPQIRQFAIEWLKSENP